MIRPRVKNCSIHDNGHYRTLSEQIFKSIHLVIHQLCHTLRGPTHFGQHLQMWNAQTKITRVNPLTTDLVRSDTGADRELRLFKHLCAHLAHAFIRVNPVLRAIRRDAV